MTGGDSHGTRTDRGEATAANTSGDETMPREGESASEWAERMSVSSAAIERNATRGEQLLYDKIAQALDAVDAANLEAAELALLDALHLMTGGCHSSLHVFPGVRFEDKP